MEEAVLSDVGVAAPKWGTMPALEQNLLGHTDDIYAMLYVRQDQVCELAGFFVRLLDTVLECWAAFYFILFFFNLFIFFFLIFF